MPISSDDIDNNGNGTTTANTLNEYLESYCRNEILQGDNVCYCPKCKKHVHTNKKLDLWILPLMLIIHLKRLKVDHAENFFHTNNRRAKLNNKTKHPIKNLDLSHMLQSSNNKKPIFDLHATSHHVSDLSSGHYAAQALNRVDNRKYFCLVANGL